MIDYPREVARFCELTAPVYGDEKPAFQFDKNSVTAKWCRGPSSKITVTDEDAERFPTTIGYYKTMRTKIYNGSRSK